MIKSINHIGIAVKNLDESIELYKKLFQLSDIHKESVVDQKVNIASFKIGEVIIELTEAMDESSPIHKFIEKRGEGIHHIAFESDAIESDLSRLKDSNINLINESPKDGAHNMLIAFLHPKSTGGVLMELCQEKGE
jgi:methylmalonyl-CoA/ethylmalonyl-CoA epimerase